MFPDKLKHGDTHDDLFREFNRLVDYLRQIRLVAGPGVALDKQPSGIVVRAVRASGGGTGMAQPEDDGGPFAVEIYNAGSGETPEWRVKLFDSKSKSGNAGLVTIGSYREMIEDQDWDAEPGIVYLDVTYDPDTEEYVVIFELEDELPETGDEQRYILRIAEITYDEDSGTYSANQIRDYGDIEVLGRWVR